MTKAFLFSIAIISISITYAGRSKYERYLEECDYLTEENKRRACKLAVTIPFHRCEIARYCMEGGTKVPRYYGESSSHKDTIGLIDIEVGDEPGCQGGEVCQRNNECCPGGGTGACVQYDDKGNEDKDVQKKTF